MKTRNHPAFTLIELLVVIAIMAVLMTLALVSFNALTQSDRVGGAANRVQSAFAGARDRAIYAASRTGASAHQPEVGVRFIVDPQMPGAVKTLQFVERPRPHTAGSIMLERPTSDGTTADSDDLVYLRGTDTFWFKLKTIGVLTNGSRIRLDGRWYSVDVSPLSVTDELLRLTLPFGDRSGIAAMPIVQAKPITSYLLELQPYPAPNTQPMDLPSGTVVDLNRSIGIPPHSTHFDIMFSPKGGCTGPVASMGVVHFYVGTAADAIEGHNATTAKDGTRGVTLRTLAGSAEIHPLDPTDANADGAPDDPFRFGK